MAGQVTGRMPTGISSLDPVLDGGIPPGSVVLLEGDIGAGNQEFAYSSIIYLSLLRQKQEAAAGMKIPETISYITFTRLKQDVLNEISLSFAPALTQNLNGSISFSDLSTHYFDSSVVPSDWYCLDDSDECKKKRQQNPEKVLQELSSHLSPGRKTTLLKLLYVTLSLANAPKPDEKKGEKGKKEANRLIVIDSLTDLATQYSDAERWRELTAFLRGLQRVAKTWNSTIYLLLTRGVLEPAREKEIADCVDAVILFRWEDSIAQRRQRTMFFEKFRGVMPHLEERELVKFAVKITPGSGFEVSNIRVVV